MFEQTFKNIDDVLWKDAGCTSELDYTEQSSWLLFLKYLDTPENVGGNATDLTGQDANVRSFSASQPKSSVPTSKA